MAQVRLDEMDVRDAGRTKLVGVAAQGFEGKVDGDQLAALARQTGRHPPRAAAGLEKAVVGAGIQEAHGERDLDTPKEVEERHPIVVLGLSVASRHLGLLGVEEVRGQEAGDAVLDRVLPPAGVGQRAFDDLLAVLP